MGSSFIRGKESGFWVSDGLIEIWLLSLAREIDALENTSDWLLEARQDWYEQATRGFMGCISPKIDEFLTSEDRQRQLIEISERALDNLLHDNHIHDVSIENWHGYGLMNTTLNTFLIGLSDFAKANTIKAGRQFIKLLRGEISTLASDGEAVSWYHD